MTKDYQQQLEDLKNGLKSILKIINKPKDLRKHQKAIEAKHIQDARIDFFKKGYNLRNREIEEQKNIKTVYLCNCGGGLRELNIKGRELFYCKKCKLFFPGKEELYQKKLR